VVEVQLNIGEGLLRQSLTTLRECGAGRHECVVVWVAKAGHASRVHRVVHPVHVAHRGGYRIDGDWLTSFWDELADNNERIVAQVHTHPRQAFHSDRDDKYPILLRPGFYSVVIPNFAQPPIETEEWFLVRLRDDGSWEELDWNAEVAA
jgi:proteasome lid subunit RPN8/RPN11